MGPNILCFNVGGLVKVPVLGRFFPPHQDFIFAAHSPRSCREFYQPDSITMWVPLHSVGTRNGALTLVPKTHREGFLKHSNTWNMGVSKLTGWGLVDYSKFQETEKIIEMKKGDALIYHCLTVHHSLTDTSKTRVAWTASYQPATTPYCNRAYKKSAGENAALISSGAVFRLSESYRETFMGKRRSPTSYSFDPPFGERLLAATIEAIREKIGIKNTGTIKWLRSLGGRRT